MNKAGGRPAGRGENITVPTSAPSKEIKSVKSKRDTSNTQRSQDAALASIEKNLGNQTDRVATHIKESSPQPKSDQSINRASIPLPVDSLSSPTRLVINEEEFDLSKAINYLERIKPHTNSSPEMDETPAKKKSVKIKKEKEKEYAKREIRVGKDEKNKKLVVYISGLNETVETIKIEGTKKTKRSHAITLFKKVAEELVVQGDLTREEVVIGFKQIKKSRTIKLSETDALKIMLEKGNRNRTERQLKAEKAATLGSRSNSTSSAIQPNERVETQTVTTTEHSHALTSPQPKKSKNPINWLKKKSHSPQADKLKIDLPAVSGANRPTLNHPGAIRVGTPAPSTGNSQGPFGSIATDLFLFSDAEVGTPTAVSNGGDQVVEQGNLLSGKPTAAHATPVRLINKSSPDSPAQPAKTGVSKLDSVLESIANFFSNIVSFFTGLFR